MKKTVFDSPFWVLFFRTFFKIGLKLAGWKLIGERPPQKCVMIGAPHTSNWDFVLMLCVAFGFRVKLFWMVKDNVYKKGYGRIADWGGGIPIDRKSAHNVVDQTVHAIKEEEEFLLVNTPEGTRSKRKKWKTGFYYIALKAQIPIQLCYVDAPNKTVGLGPVITPSGNQQEDMVMIHEFYLQHRAGIHPELFTLPLGDDFTSEK